MWGVGNDLRSDPSDLAEFIHEVLLRLQSAGCVHDHIVRPDINAVFAAFERHSGRVRAAFLLDDVAA